MIPDVDLKIQNIETRSEDQPYDVWESTKNCALSNRRLFPDYFTGDDLSILGKVIPQSNVVDPGDGIPQKTIKNNLEEDFLKAVDHLYDFEIEENQEHPSVTDLVDACSKTGDVVSNENIQEEKDSSTNSPKTDVADAEYSVVSLDEDYPPICLNHSMELEVSEVVDD